MSPWLSISKNADTERGKESSREQKVHKCNQSVIRKLSISVLNAAKKPKWNIFKQSKIELEKKRPIQKKWGFLQCWIVWKVCTSNSQYFNSFFQNMYEEPFWCKTLSKFTAENLKDHMWQYGNSMSKRITLRWASHRMKNAKDIVEFF